MIGKAAPRMKTAVSHFNTEAKADPSTFFVKKRKKSILTRIHGHVQSQFLLQDTLRISVAFICDLRGLLKLLIKSVYALRITGWEVLQRPAG